MGRKRSRIEIIADMLSSIQHNGGEMKPTHLMYKSNLSHVQMKAYLEELVEKELVAKVWRKTYEYLVVTSKGVDFHRKLKEMQEFERAFGL